MSWTLSSEAYSFNAGQGQGWLLRAQQGALLRTSEVVLSTRRETESAQAAEVFLKKLEKQPWTDTDWPQAPKKLPSCKAGLELLKPQEVQGPKVRKPASHLIDLDLKKEAKQVLKELQTPHVKVKIGTGPLKEEQSWIATLAQGLTARSGSLKLDANGTFDLKTALQWIRFLEGLQGGIAYLEQPLAVGQEKTLAAMACDTNVALALDESLKAPDGLERALEAQWPGVFAIKPILLGPPWPLFKNPEIAPRIALSCAWEGTCGLWAWIEPALSLPLAYPIGLMRTCRHPRLGLQPSPNWIEPRACQHENFERLRCRF